MQISAKRIKALQALLEDDLGLMYKGEDLEQVALAVMRFVLHKELRKQQTNDKGYYDKNKEESK